MQCNVHGAAAMVHGRYDMSRGASWLANLQVTSWVNELCERYTDSAACRNVYNVAVISGNYLHQIALLL